MRKRVVGALGALAAAASWGAPNARAAIDLVLVPDPQTTSVEAVVEIGLLAVPDDGNDKSFSAAEVALTWDPTVLELLGGFLGCFSICISNEHGSTCLSKSVANGEANACGTTGNNSLLISKANEFIKWHILLS